MVTHYRISATTIVELDVSEEVSTCLTESYRKEDNLDRKSRYHNVSLESCSNLLTASVSPESILVEKENLREKKERLDQALDALTKIQRRRLLLIAAGLSTREIARLEGVNQRTVQDSLELARKKISKFF